MSMDARVMRVNQAPVRRPARYVLYWCRTNRRVESNHALEFAAALANREKLPLLFHEDLSGFENARYLRFALEGAADNARAAARRGIGYNAGGDARRLAEQAAAVVTDDHPLVEAPDLDVAGYAVDSSCVVPMRLLEKKEYGAYTIRPKIRKLLPAWLRPVDKVRLDLRWKGPTGAITPGETGDPVPPSVCYKGGRRAALRQLHLFLDRRLSRYAGERNLPSARATSELSPWLRFGHISSLEVALAAQLHAAEHGIHCEEFLEELIVRRELAFNHARLAPRPASFDSLPDWARRTLGRHARDPREACYSVEEFERAATHDALWNATQRELLLCGRIHGYYRMYWGKKIIQWSPSHQAALDTMLRLHDRYALDGRDPNTYTNILWCFGLHDRPWKERPVFGTLRYLSLDGMRRKTDVEAYLHQISRLPEPPQPATLDKDLRGVAQPG